VRQPTDTSLKAPETRPDRRARDKPVISSKRTRSSSGAFEEWVPSVFGAFKKCVSWVPRLNFSLKKWAFYVLIAVTILLFGSATYRYKTALQPRHTKAMSLPQDEKSIAKWVTGQLSSPKAEEILSRDSRSITITEFEIRDVTSKTFLVMYKWASSKTPRGSTAYKYIYDRQARKIDPQYNSDFSVPPISKTDKSELSRIAEELGDLLFKEN
jgi:hypothetical protein